MKISLPRPSQLPKVYLTLKQSVILFVVIVYFTALWMGRYTIVTVSAKPVTAYKLDRWTGEVWEIRGGSRYAWGRLVRESRKR